MFENALKILQDSVLIRAGILQNHVEDIIQEINICKHQIHLKKNIDNQIYHTYGYTQRDIHIPKDSKILIFDNDEQSIQPMTRFILANPTKMAMWLKIVL